MIAPTNEGLVNAIMENRLAANTKTQYARKVKHFENWIIKNRPLRSNRELYDVTIRNDATDNEIDSIRLNGNNIRYEMIRKLPCQISLDIYVAKGKHRMIHTYSQ